MQNWPRDLESTYQLKKSSFSKCWRRAPNVCGPRAQTPAFWEWWFRKKLKRAATHHHPPKCLFWAIHVSQIWPTPVHNVPRKLWTHAAFVADSSLYSPLPWLDLEKGLHQLTISQGNCQPVSLNQRLHGLTIPQGNRKRMSEKKSRMANTKSLDLCWPSIILATKQKV